MRKIKKLEGNVSVIYIGKKFDDEILLTKWLFTIRDPKQFKKLTKRLKKFVKTVKASRVELSNEKDFIKSKVAKLILSAGKDDYLTHKHLLQMCKKYKLIPRNENKYYRNIASYYDKEQKKDMVKRGYNSDMRRKLYLSDFMNLKNGRFFLKPKLN